MENFRKGDFIRLKNLERWQINRITGKEINVFEINNIEPEYAEVKNCNEKIPISEIEPIPINGKDDAAIYYDPIIVAPLVYPGDPIPVYIKNRSYYFDSFKSHYYEGKNFQEIVIEQNFQCVHQVQHFLFDKFQDDGIKFDAI